MLTAYIARVLASTGGEESKEKAESLKRALDYLNTRADTDRRTLLTCFLRSGRAQRARYVPRKTDHRETIPVGPSQRQYKLLDTRNEYAFLWLGTGRTSRNNRARGPGPHAYCIATAKCESDPKLTAGAVLFLLKQKDRYGVWYSTQATINVLDALLSLLATQSQNNSATRVNGRHRR